MHHENSATSKSSNKLTFKFYLLQIVSIISTMLLGQLTLLRYAPTTRARLITRPCTTAAVPVPASHRAIRTHARRYIAASAAAENEETQPPSIEQQTTENSPLDTNTTSIPFSPPLPLPLQPILLALPPPAIANNNRMKKTKILVLKQQKQPFVISTKHLLKFSNLLFFSLSAIWL